MWSFGCIIAELTTGRPLFPALDENELLELVNMMIGSPSQDMIKRAKKRKQFYDKDCNIIISKKSRVFGVETLSYPIRNALSQDADDEFIDFILKCLEVDPNLRWTPDEALKHPWLKRKGSKSVLKDNEDVV
jgi:dual specificity tyrosine-phosphorylation-regulated kinase 2/3/4